MLISYQWLKSLLGADPGVETVARRLTLAGLEVEAVEHHGAHLRAVRVARVLSSRPHPSSKNPLTLVTVDTGRGVPLEVVCGAPNVPAPGGLVCFAPAGAQVFDKKGQLFTLERKPVAGIVSEGMLCAEDELGLGSDHSGIVVLEGGEPGQSLLEYAPELEDWVLHVNVTPNRPDALGHVGVARDLGALLGVPFEQRPPRAPRRVSDPIGDALRVRIEDPERCPRYTAALVREVRVGPSPLWLRARLHRLGVRAINNVVDVTNLVMLEYGQPLHAFDLDRLAEHTIVVRRAREGEAIQTLDGITRALSTEDLVIADAARPVAIAGVMGGKDSGISDTTRMVALESAYFEARGIRRTARRHAMHTDASHRFERGADVAAAPLALAAAAAWLSEIAGGAVASDTIDAYPRPIEPRRVTLRPARARALLGVEIPLETMTSTLGALGFHLEERSESALRARVPSHRPDIEREVDLIEEVGRIWGLDHIEGRLPPQSGARAGTRGDFWLRRRMRELCAALGLDEAVSYAFVSPRELAAAGFGDTPVVRLTNPLSEERSVMRPTLLSRLFAAAAHAYRHGEPRVRLFEVGTVFSPEGPCEPGLVHEETRVAWVLTGPRDAYLQRGSDVDFYDAKGLVEELVEQLANLPARFTHASAPPAWAHPRAVARVDLDGDLLGWVGEVHPDVRERMDLPRASVAAELLAAPLASPRRPRVARVPSRFPTVRRDVALLLDQKHPAGAVADMLRALAGPLCESVEIFDRYVGKELPPGTHSLGFTLRFRSDERTLTDAEVDALTEKAVKGVCEAFGAQQR